MAENEKLYLGIDIGGTHLRMALADDSIKSSSFELLKTPEVFGNTSDPSGKLAENIRGYCERHLGGRMPAAVSIGFPSTLNRERTIVLQTPNIACIPDDFPVVKELTDILGIPVFINRDVNNLLLYDMNNLGIDLKSTVTGIYFGTGIGNSVVIDGKFMYGRDGVAAELGHIPVLGNRRKCTCGNTGCLETVISGIALQRIRAENFPETEIGEIFAEHGTSPVIEEFLEGMAQTIALEINIFDPDYMVLGGGLFQMKGIPMKRIEEYVHFYARKPYPEKDLRILYSKPDQENGTLGAVLYAKRRMTDREFL